MTARSLLLQLGCCALLLGSIGPSRARAEGTGGDVDAGRAHFDRGVEYVQDGDLRAALIEFKRAYVASPNYRVLYNLGQVCNELREYTEAQRYFQRYLSEGGDEIPAGRKRDVESILSKLSGRIATLVLSTNVAGAELFVDNVAVGKSPLNEPVRVSTGKRVISAAISGRPRVLQAVEAAGGETLVVRLDFSPNVREEVHPTPRAAAEPSVRSGGTRPALWLGIGAGALAVGTGVMAFLAAQDASKYDDAVHRKTTARELDELDSSATTKALVADILLGATAVATTLTVIFALQGDGGSERPPSARLRVGPGGLGLRGSF